MADALNGFTEMMRTQFSHLNHRLDNQVTAHQQNTRQLDTIALQHTEQQDEIRGLRGANQAGFDNLTRKVDTNTALQRDSATETRRDFVVVRTELGQLREGLDEVRNEVGGLRTEQESVKVILADSRIRNEPPAAHLEDETVWCPRCNRTVRVEFWLDHYRQCSQIERRSARDLSSSDWNVTCPRCQQLVEAQLFDEHLQTCRGPGQMISIVRHNCKTCNVLIDETSFIEHSQECAAKAISEPDGDRKKAATFMFEVVQSSSSKLKELLLCTVPDAILRGDCRKTATFLFDVLQSSTIKLKEFVFTFLGSKLGDCGSTATFLFEALQSPTMKLKQLVFTALDSELYGDRIKTATFLFDVLQSSTIKLKQLVFTDLDALDVLQSSPTKLKELVFTDFDVVYQQLQQQGKPGLGLQFIKLLTQGLESSAASYSSISSPSGEATIGQESDSESGSEDNASEANGKSGGGQVDHDVATGDTDYIRTTHARDANAQAQHRSATVGNLLAMEAVSDIPQDQRSPVTAPTPMGMVPTGNRSPLAAVRNQSQDQRSLVTATTPTATVSTGRRSQPAASAGGELALRDEALRDEALLMYATLTRANITLEYADYLQMILIMRSQPFNLAVCEDPTSDISESEDEEEIPGDGPAETDSSDLTVDEVMQLMAQKLGRKTLRLDIRANIYRKTIRKHLHALSLAINAVHIVGLLRKEQGIPHHIGQLITCADTPYSRAELLLRDYLLTVDSDVLCRIVEDYLPKDILCFVKRTEGNQRVQRAVCRTFWKCHGERPEQCNGNNLHGLPMTTMASRATASAASAAAQPSEGSLQDVLPANATAAVVACGVVHVVQDQNVGCSQEAPHGQSLAAECVHRPLATLDKEQLECAGGLDPDSLTDPTHRPQQPSQAVTDDATPAIDAVTTGPPVIASNGADGDASDLPAIHVISKSLAPTTADDTAVGADWGRDVINDVIGEAGAVMPGPAQPAAVASSEVITEHHSVTPILAADSAGDIAAQASSVVSPTSASKAEGLATAQMIPSISAPALGASKKSQDSDDEDFIGFSSPHHGFPLLLDEDMAGEQYPPAAVQATPANSHADPLLASIMSDEEEDEDTSASLTQDAYAMTQLSLQGDHVVSLDGVAGEEPAVAFSPLLESPSLISVAGTSNGSAGVFLGSDSASAGVATAASDCDVTAGNSGDSLPVTTSRCFRR